MAAPKGAPSLHRLRSEEGAVAVLTALLLIVIFASVAFAIDLARLRHERHVLQAAVDLASLAGAGHLPVQGAAEAGVAASAARQIAVANAPGLAGGGLDVTFKCIVAGLDDGSIADMSYACGPAGGGTWGSGWTLKRSKAFHDCNPYAGDLCNTIIARASSIVPYFFAPVIGVNQGSTGAVRGAACKGFCGDPSAPLDVVMVLDRSTSMTNGDMANLKNAALSVLDVYDPAIQSVALVALPYTDPTNKCIANPIQNYPAVGRMWQITGLLSDYKTSSGALNPSSQIVADINCMQRATNLTSVTPSGSGHTDLGDPMATATSILLSDGRPDVPDVIIFMTDGEANQPKNNQPCQYAVTRGQSAEAAGIDVYTIGYGVASARCTYDTVGTYRNAYASKSLADMASGGAIDNAPGGCAADENTDGDNYFCESGSADLEPVFRLIAASTVQRARLIDI
jgi:hypothetical protein